MGTRAPSTQATSTNGSLPAPFSCRTSRVGETVVIEVAGEVDLETAPQLDRALDVPASAATRIVVVLTDVDYLDSSGLNALLRSQKRLAERAIEIRLVVSPTHRVVRSMLEITDTLAPLGVVDTLAEALVR